VPYNDTVFAAWGSWVAWHCRTVLAVALTAVLGAGLWGAGVFGQLTEGGYNDPNSESSRAADVVRAELGARGVGIGIGMIIALFLDATVVRMLLVPAILTLMGDAAWWPPGLLRRLQQRAAP
jgi:uncharacterized membrane protein YdfJ with MMPL/SSD domain